VEIIVENNDGSIIAHINIRYVKICPPRKVSDEKKKQVEKDFNRCGRINRDKRKCLWHKNRSIFSVFYKLIDML